MSPALVWTASGEFYKLICQKRPEKILARIADHPADFVPVIHDDKSRGKFDAVNILEVIRPFRFEIDQAQWRAL